jgi:hypothetical protein
MAGIPLRSDNRRDGRFFAWPVLVPGSDLIALHFSFLDGSAIWVRMQHKHSLSVFAFVVFKI